MFQDIAVKCRRGRHERGTLKRLRSAYSMAFVLGHLDRRDVQF